MVFVIFFSKMPINVSELFTVSSVVRLLTDMDVLLIHPVVP